MSKDIGKDSLKFHKKHQGKLAVSSKVKLKDKKDLSLAYTPGVGAVSKDIADHPERVYDYTLKKNTVAIVSDGSAILGLGNLGPEAALPVMEGKAILFKEFGGVDAFPICLATQNVDEIVETVIRIAPNFGGINLEDISAPRCFEVERKLKERLNIPVMHDDQHGTAVVVLAALINATKLRRLKAKEARIVMNGAGAAGTAVAKLLLEYGFKDLIVCDTHGAIYSDRPEIALEKAELARLTNPRRVAGELGEVIKGAHVFIGLSKGNLLNAEMVKSMAKDPIVFALANPTPEIMPDVAKGAGAFIVATGRSDFPNQINNLLAFPGIFRGALDRRVVDLDDKMFLKAAIGLAGYQKNLSREKILPSPLDKKVAQVVAKAIR